MQWFENKNGPGAMQLATEIKYVDSSTPSRRNNAGRRGPVKEAPFTVPCIRRSRVCVDRGSCWRGTHRGCGTRADSEEFSGLRVAFDIKAEAPGLAADLIAALHRVVGQDVAGARLGGSGLTQFSVSGDKSEDDTVSPYSHASNAIRRPHAVVSLFSWAGHTASPVNGHEKTRETFSSPQERRPKTTHNQPNAKAGPQLSMGTSTLTG